MLPKKQRLPIQAFLKQKTREVRTPCFTLKIFSPHTPLPRLGVVVGRSVAGRATERNRWHRLFFEIFRRHQTTIPLRDYLLILLPRITHAQRAAVQEEFLHSLQK